VIRIPAPPPSKKKEKRGKRGKNVENAKFTVLKYIFKDMCVCMYV